MQYRTGDPAKAALLARQYPEVDYRFAIQQIEGWQKAQDKLPELSQFAGWWWPARVSMEQCSSETTARYKRRLIERWAGAEVVVTDLTGGLGIDAYYMRTRHYVEHQEDLCRIAEHNFHLAGQDITVHHDEAEQYLSRCEKTELIYLDPARRDIHGGKVFRLEDCTPNVVTLYDQLMEKTDRLMLKLSPMLDITDALRHLPDAEEVHVVAVKNEVKEVLVLCQRTEQERRSVVRHCVNLLSDEPELVYHEESANTTMATAIGTYLYEPNAAIMKAGAYKVVGERYGVAKLSENSHLYTSDEVIRDFPGRTWRVEVVDKQAIRQIGRCNILCRNYPLKPEEVRKKYKLQDGGEQYLIGTRIGSQAILLLGTRI